MNDPSKHHEHRLSHAERKITELEQELSDLRTRNSQLALHIAELEAALIRVDDVKQDKGWWNGFA